MAEDERAHRDAVWLKARESGAKIPRGAEAEHLRKTRQMPAPFIPGLIPTLNDTGFMTETMDEYSRAFVDYAATCKRPVLDMGCAYGVATLPALATGATVVACDMDPGHVEILAGRVPEEHLPRLTTDSGTLPDVDYPSGKFDAILAARVLHFLHPAEVEKTVEKMADWLAPGGKMFLITDAIYTGFWRKHLPIYEEKKAAGDPWPGEIDNVNKYLPNIESAPMKVLYMNILDPDNYVRLADSNGLEVEQVGYLAPNKEDSGKAYGDREKERVGLIARKPG